MRLKNIVIVVEDMERSKNFYKELFGLNPVRQFEGNVVLTEGLVLQEKTGWEKLNGKMVSFGGSACELYFETHDLEAFQKKLDDSGLAVEYLCRLTTYEWGQRAIRFYDPDGHLIEVGEA
ncbi:MAG: VOC family protein [Lachnospiraceae bacterium]|nr:VOC family protein [Lachnospiraceae bacterium]